MRYKGLRLNSWFLHSAWCSRQKQLPDTTNASLKSSIQWKPVLLQRSVETWNNSSGESKATPIAPFLTPWYKDPSRHAYTLNNLIEVANEHSIYRASQLKYKNSNRTVRWTAILISPLLILRHSTLFILTASHHWKHSHHLKRKTTHNPAKEKIHTRASFQDKLSLSIQDPDPRTSRKQR